MYMGGVFRYDVIQEPVTLDEFHLRSFNTKLTDNTPNQLIFDWVCQDGPGCILKYLSVFVLPSQVKGPVTYFGDFALECPKGSILLSAPLTSFNGAKFELNFDSVSPMMKEIIIKASPSMDSGYQNWYVNIGFLDIVSLI